MSNIIRLDKSGRLSIDGQKPAAPSASGATAVLVIDRSGSMAGPKIGFASSGAWDFSQAALKKGYRIAAIDFASGAAITCAPSQLGRQLKTAGVEILAIGTDDADKEFLSQLASRPDLGILVASRGLRQAITDASRLLGKSRK